MKALDFLSVHARFGPYITMAGKMVMNMSSIVVMLFYLSKLLTYQSVYAGDAMDFLTCFWPGSSIYHISGGRG